MEEESAYKWFCEQYDGNEIAQGLIRQLSQANRYLSDRWSVAYGQQVHTSVEIGDLVEVPGIPERATLDCIFKSLLKRAPSSVVDVDAVEEERERYLNLLESCDLADMAKKEIRARLDALAFSTYCLPSQPWVTSSPFIDLVCLEGQSIALHCQKLPSRCLRVDFTGRVVATEAARTWAWKVVELMLHVIWASGHHDTSPTTVFVGFCGGEELLDWGRKTFDPKKEMATWAVKVLLLGGHYQTSVLEKLQTPVKEVDLGHEHYDTGQQPGKFALNTEVYKPTVGRTGAVINGPKKLKGKTQVQVSYKPKQSSNRNVWVEVDLLRVVAIKSNDKDELLPPPMVGRLAVVAKGWNGDIYGRVVRVESIHDDYCHVHYTKDGERVPTFRIRKKYLRGLEEEEQPSTRWHIAMFVPDSICNAVGLNEQGTVDPKPVVDMMNQHLAPHGSTLVRFKYPSRAKTTSDATQSQWEGVPIDDLGEDQPADTDDAYEWICTHKSSERWTWVCDRGKRSRPSKAPEGNARTSKKVAYPVKFHLWKVNGRWVVGQTCSHQGHQVDVADRFTPLSTAAKETIQRLHGIGFLNPMKIYLAIQKNMAFPLPEKDLLLCTQYNVAREINRLQQLDRGRSRNQKASIQDLIAQHPELYGQSMEVKVDVPDVYHLCIRTPFQREMLELHGDFVMLDSVHKVIHDGLNQLTLMVIDETGRGIPVGYSLTSREDEEAWVELLQYCFRDLDRQLEDTITISDCAPEINAACEKMAKKHLLCAFHVTQSINRRLKRGDDWVQKTKPKERRELASKIVGMFKNLRLTKDRETFWNAWGRFLGLVQTHTGNLLRKDRDGRSSFLSYMESTWKGKAHMWAAWGRQGVSWHRHDTTNSLESYFNGQKYHFSDRKRICKLPNHVRLLVETIVPYFEQRRRDVLCGLAENARQRRSRNLDEIKQRLVADGIVHVVKEDIGLGLVPGNNTSDAYEFCLGDLSCTCEDGRAGQVCIHLEAASELLNTGVTVSMIQNSAALVGQKMERVKWDDDVWVSPGIAAPKNLVDSHSQITTNFTEETPTCTCHVYSCGSKDLCPHIVAQQPDLLDIEDADSPVVQSEDIRAFRPTLPLPITNEGHSGVVWGPSQVENSRFYGQEYINSINRLSSSQNDTAESQAEVIPAMENLVDVLNKHSSELAKGYRDEDVHGYERNRQRGCKRAAASRKHHPLQPSRRKRR